MRGVPEQCVSHPAVDQSPRGHWESGEYIGRDKQAQTGAPRTQPGRIALVRIQGIMASVSAHQGHKRTTPRHLFGAYAAMFALVVSKGGRSRIVQHEYLKIIFEGRCPLRTWCLSLLRSTFANLQLCCTCTGIGELALHAPSAGAPAQYLPTRGIL